MNIKEIKSFLGRCFLINLVLMIFTTLIIVTLHDQIYEIYREMFSLKMETYSALLFGYLAVWKILNLVFFGIPYVALWLMENKAKKKDHKG